MKKIVIIGGGLSGLTCGYKLSRSDEFEITIVEQNAEIGGRVKTVVVEGIPVNVGGFIVFKWYKHFRSIVKELGLESLLKTLPIPKDYWYINNSFEVKPLLKKQQDEQAAIKEAQTEIEKQKAEISSLRSSLATMSNSASWKITKPLRMARSIARKLTKGSPNR